MQFTLTHRDVHACTTGILRNALRLTDYKRSCPVPTLLSVVYVACARVISVSAAALTLLRGPSPETLLSKGTPRESPAIPTYSNNASTTPYEPGFHLPGNDDGDGIGWPSI